MHTAILTIHFGVVQFVTSVTNYQGRTELIGIMATPWYPTNDKKGPNCCEIEFAQGPKGARISVRPW